MWCQHRTCAHASALSALDYCQESLGEDTPGPARCQGGSFYVIAAYTSTTMDTSIKVKTIHLRFHDPADVRSLSQREHGSVDPQEGVADGNMLRRKDEGRLQSGPVGHNADTSAPAQQRDASKLAVRRRVVPSRRAGRLSSSGMSVTTKSSPQVPR